MLCSRGWLIDQQEDGTYLPFFVTVREEDLIWSTDIPDPGIEGILKNSDEYKIITPTSKYRIKRREWVADIYSDGSFDMSRCIPIQDFFMYDEPRNIEASFYFPFYILNDNDKFFQLTVESDLLEIQTAQSSMTDYKNESLYVKGVTISLWNGLYGFHYDFKTNEKYKNSKIHISIHGNLLLTPL